VQHELKPLFGLLLAAAGGAPRKVACQIYGIDEFWFVADTSAVYYRSWVRDLIGSLPTTPNGVEPF
jgi:hypothetical protein